MERLGEPVHNVASAKEPRQRSPVTPSKRKIVNSLDDLSPSKKKEKKEKKKKDKREKKKKKRSKSSKAAKEESEDEASANDDDDDKAVFDADEEELLSFFEDLTEGDKKKMGKDGEATQDDLMRMMKRKNAATMKRIKEIEEDKKRHK